MQLKKGVRVLWITIILNILLSVFKVFAGIIGQSTVVIADGIHSLSDVITSFFALAGIKLAAKEEDKGHPYGHDKYEAVFANLICIILIFTGLALAYNSILKIFADDLPPPGNIALWAAVISILVKEAMYWFTIKVAKELKSLAMEADAWHHRSDAISSIIALVAVFGSKKGYLFLDPLAGIIISILIIKIGVEFFLKAIRGLVDTSVEPETLQKIQKIVLRTPGVSGIKEIKSRVFGNKFYVDINIYLAADLNIKEAHDIVILVHDRVEEEIEDCKHCLVHVDPY